MLEKIRETFRKDDLLFQKIGLAVGTAIGLVIGMVISERADQYITVDLVPEEEDPNGAEAN